MEQAEGASEVLSDAIASRIREPEVAAALHLSAVAGLLEQADGAGHVLSDTCASRIREPEVAAALHYLGFAYETGAGVAQDMARAVGLYQQACDGGLVEACSRE